MQKETKGVQDSLLEDEDEDEQPLRVRKRMRRSMMDARKRARDAGTRDRNE